MNRLFPSRLWLLILFMLCLFASVGCAPTGDLQQTDTPIPPTNTFLQANLIVKRLPLQVARGDGAPYAPEPNESVPIAVNDGITVGDQGRGVLEIGDDRVTVDLFRGSDIAVSELIIQPGGSLSIELKRPKGHSRVTVKKNARSHVLYDSDLATILTLRDDTQFIVCNAPEKVTCLVVTKGEVEVTAQNETITVKGGEATYIKKGLPPSPQIRVRPTELGIWFDKLEGDGKFEALGALVDRWVNDDASAVGNAQVVPTATSSPPPDPKGMVKVPVGSYTIGAAADDNHIAMQQIEVAEFWIDAYLVTNAQYQTFLDSTGHTPPPTWLPRGMHPVRGVTWDDAAAYCSWARKRLPKEQEWEVAARGPGENPALYPWGTDPFAGGEIDTLPLTDTYMVGDFDFNKSPFGVYDMARNVWQWVSDPYAAVPEGMKVLRGGRFGYTKDMAFRQPAEPASATFVPFAGFRCAADYVGGK